jgi:hypothetical protein
MADAADGGRGIAGIKDWIVIARSDSDEAIQSLFAVSGLLRFARNDAI